MDEVFQNETRFPGGEWKPAAEPYADVVREHTTTHAKTHNGVQVTEVLFVVFAEWGEDPEPRGDGVSCRLELGG